MPLRGHADCYRDSICRRAVTAVGLYVAPAATDAASVPTGAGQFDANG